MICGEDTFIGMAEFGQGREKWFKRFLRLPNGIPSHDTFNRVFSALDPEEFLGAFVRWTQGVRRAFSGEVVALDGKALRRAVEAGQSAPVVVGAWAAGAGISLGQVAVEDKSNEWERSGHRLPGGQPAGRAQRSQIKAVPVLLEALALKGCIVTADAMGCQKEVAAKVREKGADYVLALKGNHPFLHQAASTFLDELAAARRRQRDRLPRGT